MPRGTWRISCLKAHNGEHDLDHDDDQHVYRWDPNNPPYFPPNAGQPSVIIFKQPRVWETVSHRLHEVHVSSYFMQSVVLNLSGVWMMILLDMVLWSSHWCQRGSILLCCIASLIVLTMVDIKRLTSTSSHNVTLDNSFTNSKVLNKLCIFKLNIFILRVQKSMENLSNGEKKSD